MFEITECERDMLVDKYKICDYHRNALTLGGTCAPNQQCEHKRIRLRLHMIRKGKQLWGRKTKKCYERQSK